MTRADNAERESDRQERLDRVRAERAEHARRIRAERDEHAERLRVMRADRADARRGRDNDVEDDSPGTRERIQQVALELFIENGYEATSLREIAERLGVTKAALYYHFKTKDDIIASLAQSRISKVDELLAWAAGEPRTAATREEFVRRYALMLDEGGSHQQLMRFFERNQTVMHRLKSGSTMRDKMYDLLEVLSDPEDPLSDQLRCSLAIFALHATCFVIRSPDVTDAQRRAASLDVALDLIKGRGLSR